MVQCGAVPRGAVQYSAVYPSTFIQPTGTCSIGGTAAAEAEATESPSVCTPGALEAELADGGGCDVS